MKELCNTVNVNDGKKGRSEFFHQIKLLSRYVIFVLSVPVEYPVWFGNVLWK